MPQGTPGAAGLLLGFAADRVLGDPQRWHPVAGFGWVAQGAEQALYADTRARGVGFTAALVGGSVGLGILIDRAPVHRAIRTLATAVATWAVLGGRSLEREALAVHHHLAVDDLAAARTQVTRLVGRDTTELDASEVTRAVVESVAENTSDAVVAPLVWGAFFGVPGLLGYRAVNTLDAMVGHHNGRYENFGWASARLDDLANLPGSRLTGLLGLMAAPSHAREGWRTWRRDAAAHPSPNGGVVESVFAGLLGIHLGGTNQYYGDRVEHRAIMGDGRAAEPSDIPAATVLARRIGWSAALAAAGAAALIGRRR
jgi:adenosylcobinamide-phosphate synthase